MSVTISQTALNICALDQEREKIVCKLATLNKDYDLDIRRHYAGWLTLPDDQLALLEEANKISRSIDTEYSDIDRAVYTNHRFPVNNLLASSKGVRVQH